MILDLTKSAKFSPEIRLIFNNICKENEKNFNDLIDKIPDDNLDLLISLPLSRNTFHSNIFYFFCCILLVSELTKRNTKITKILVDSNAVKNILQKNENIKPIEIVVKSDKKIFNSIYYLKLFSFIIKNFLKKFFQVLFCKLTKNHNFKFEENLILIDTYVLPGFYSKDRYFCGLLDFLSENEQKNVFFIPTISYTGFWNYYSVYTELRNSKRNFLIKEDFLKISDILYSVLYCYRIQFLKIKSLIYNNFDFSNLINEELKNISGYNLPIEGLINYRFSKRIGQKGIKVKLLIDWWENQATDKCLNKGMKENYESLKIKGYLGYVPRNMELQLVPTKKEKKNKLIPHVINFIGKKFLEDPSYKGEEFDYDFAPAFRFNHIYDKEIKHNKSDKYNVIIALPYLEKESINIINLINNIKNDHVDDIEFKIKFHPISNNKYIIDNLKNKLNKKIKTVSENEKIFDTADLIISSVSSVCLESIAMGVPAIIVKQQYGIEYNPIPKKISSYFYKFCDNEKEIYESIQYFKNILNFKIDKLEEINEIKNDYFQIPNRVEIKKLLNI